MSERPFMQLYVSDFLGDTLSLSTEQLGAYMLLLMAMWNAKGSLPNDPVKLARIARMSVKKWQAIADDVLAFFNLDGTSIRHNRVTFELQKVERKSELRAAAGAKGGKSKSLKNNDKAEANATDLPPHTRASHNQNHNQNKNHPSDGNAQARDPTPRELLLTVLSPETADAVMQHRKAKRAPLSTLLAARGLVTAFKEYPEGPEAAAALMVTSGWTGFKREYWEKRPAMGGQRRMTAAEETGQRLAQRIEGLTNGRTNSSGEGSGDLWPADRLLAAGGQAHRPPAGQLR